MICFLQKSLFKSETFMLKINIGQMFLLLQFLLKAHKEPQFQYLKNI
jgi:hypothetical protein